MGGGGQQRDKPSQLKASSCFDSDKLSEKETAERKQKSSQWLEPVKPLGGLGRLEERHFAPQTAN